MARARAKLHIEREDLRATVARSLHARAAERAQDMRNCWDAVLTVLYAVEKRLFENEGRDTEHAAWAPLRNGGERFHDGLGYLDWKRLYYPGMKKLHLTGKLERQLTGGGGAYIDRRANGLTFGTDYENFDGVPNRPRPSPPYPANDRIVGDLGGVTAGGRMSYYPMEPRPPIRLDAPAIGMICHPIQKFLLHGYSGARGAYSRVARMPRPIDWETFGA